jgi:hypothetical protein
MLVLPGPGLIALAIGIILLGRRDRLLRRAALALHMALRGLSRAEQPKVRAVGAWLRARHAGARRFVRDEVIGYGQGRSLRLVTKIWIGITLLLTALAAGVGLIALFS